MKKIKAILMVRKIRDNQSKEIAGNSAQEIIQYFKKKADKLDKKIERLELNLH